MYYCIDTHCHIDLILKAALDQPITPAVNNATEQLLYDAAAASVSTVITIGTNRNDSLFGAQLAQAHNNLYATVGIHPTEYTASWRSDIALLQQLLTSPLQTKIVGIGECGIDTYRTTVSISQQKDLFRAQIDCALQYDRCLVIHSRASADETLSCLDEYRDEPLRAVIHCFSYTLPYAEEYRARSIMLGIGGTITYPANESLRDVIRALPRSAWVLETDAPFLAPQSIRGKPNNPAQIHTIAQYIADLLSIDVATIAEATSSNARSLFRLHSMGPE